MIDSKLIVPAICPRCGANIKVNSTEETGFCEYCRTDFIIQDAIQKVEIKGNVKIDNSEFVNNQLINARRAKIKEDWEDTEKYYSLVEQYEPYNIEAIFYSSYGKVKLSLMNPDLIKRQSAFNVLTNCVNLISNNYNLEKDEQEIPVIKQISDDIFSITNSDFTYNKNLNNYGNEVSSDKGETIKLFNKLQLTFIDSLETIANKYIENEKDKDASEMFYILCLKHSEFLLNKRKFNFLF